VLTEYNGIAYPTSNASCYAADFRLSGTAISANRAANSCKARQAGAEMNGVIGVPSSSTPQSNTYDG
jgi:hypothetical protein